MLDVIYMVPCVLGEDDDIVEIHQVYLPTHARQDDVQGALK